MRLRARSAVHAALAGALSCCVAAAELQHEEWNGTYRCGPTKRDTEGSGYTSPVKLVVRDGAATIVRDSSRVREALSGTVTADGSLTLEGTGHAKDSGSTWRYRFEGRFQGNRFEATGAMFASRGGPALRECSMTLSGVGRPPAARIQVPPIEKKEPPPQAAAPAPAKAATPAPTPAVPPPQTKPPEPAAPLAEESETPAASAIVERALGRLSGYSRTDLTLLAIFIITAVAGIALLIYDWRRNHRR